MALMAAAPPKSTTVAPPKLSRTVTLVPPAVEPKAGLMPVIVGGGSAPTTGGVGRPLGVERDRGSEGIDGAIGVGDATPKGHGVPAAEGIAGAAKAVEGQGGRHVVRLGGGRSRGRAVAIEGDGVGGVGCPLGVEVTVAAKG